MWVWLITKLPFLGKINPKIFIIFGIAVVLGLTVLSIKSFINDQINTGIVQSEQKAEITELKTQLKTLQDNQKIIDDVGKETTIIINKETIKHESIRENIDEEIKNGNDDYVGLLLTNTIDRM